MGDKIPVSVLALIHTPAPDFQVLLLERADRPGYWQSVTGSQDPGETLRETLLREVREETGLDAGRFPVRDWRKTNRYEIYPHWRHRYPDGVTHNTEHVFSLELPAAQAVTIAPGEHLAWQWLPLDRAADKVFSWSNRDAILDLPNRVGI
ncbi:MAG: dihydroneopterin triphosphate diphosphatase [Burkholderiales bacterium]